ncbi:MAG: 3-oxocholest-4-en-26-oate---CoA ligase [Actinomycetota bacterium]|nr:3-oxocholest-4-en-26-oate---CoA ligase [Actinomycetota bacterium]
MDWNYASIYESVADALPDHTALIQGQRTRTWRELDDRAARLAAGLRAAGLGPDSKVASYLYNSNEYIEGLLGTFKLRAVPVNVNYRYLEEELVYLLDNSDAEALLFHGSLSEFVAKIAGRAPKLKLLVQVDDGAPLIDGAVEYEALLAANDPMERIERSGDDYYFLYTGGTTGMPKGVMWRNEDLVGVLLGAVYPLYGAAMPERSADAGAIAKQIVESGRTTVHLPASPLMHGTGAFTSLQAMSVGGAIVTLESRTFDPHELWRVVQERRVTQMAIVGDAFAKPMLRALDEADAAGRPYDISSLALIVSSGVMWSAEVKEKLVARGNMFLLDSLGSSEAVGMANSMSGPGSATATAHFTIGENSKVFTDDGTEVVPGSDEIGVLAVGGYIPAGYYKDEAKSASTFRTFAGRRWSVPGDFASVDADGGITLLGRGSVCINSGGEKVFPEEVEEAVKRHPSVADALVIGVPDERFGEAVVAVVGLRAGEEAASDDITGALQDLAKYKRPRSFVFVDAVKRGPNGKADYVWAKETVARELGTR